MTYGWLKNVQTITKTKEVCLKFSPIVFAKMLIVACIVCVIGIIASLDAEASTCRNPAVKHQFDKEQGYPHGRKGYIVDHICALARGGIDATSNMQYQTIAESKAKDKIENTDFGAAQFCTSENSTPTRQVFNCK